MFDAVSTKSWASEVLFPGAGPLGDFSKISPGGTKSGGICFSHSKSRKQPFAEIFKIQGGLAPPAPPSDAHAQSVDEVVYFQKNIPNH